jgi:hypothetical protein
MEIGNTLPVSSNNASDSVGNANTQIVYLHDASMARVLLKAISDLPDQ